MSGDAAPHVVEDCLGAVQLLSDGTVLRSDEALALPPPTFPDVPGVEWKDVAYDAARGLKVRVYRPPAGAADKRLPVLVYFHGGGFCLGTFDHPHVHALCLRLAAELPAVVLSADYRLAPEHRLPAAIDDGAAVLAWLRGHAQEPPSPQPPGATEPWLAESADFTRVFVSGESAGANVAHHVAVRLGSEALAGCILITPFFSGAERTGTESEPPADGVFFTIEISDQFWRLSLPAGATRDHPAANPFGPGSPSLVPVALPPVLAVAAGRDLLRDRVVGYAERLRAMGKAVELAVLDAEEHGFSFAWPWGEAATEMIRAMKRFVQEGARPN